jgi:hypothetical protein
MGSPVHEVTGFASSEAPCTCSYAPWERRRSSLASAPTVIAERPAVRNPGTSAEAMAPVSLMRYRTATVPRNGLNLVCMKMAKNGKLRKGFRCANEVCHNPSDM